MTSSTIRSFGESEHLHVVGGITAGSIVGVVGIACVVVTSAIVSGIWLGVLLPVFIHAPFLMYGRVLAPEHRWMLRRCVASHHIVAWAAIFVWPIAIDGTYIVYPTGAGERAAALTVAIGYSLVTLIATRGGSLLVLCRWSACRANWRAIRRALTQYTPLREIGEACVREGRCPTPQEHARIVDVLLDTIDNGRHSVSLDALPLLTERDRIYADHVSEVSRATRSMLEGIDLAIAQSDYSSLQANMKKRIAEITVAIEGGRS